MGQDYEPEHLKVIRLEREKRRDEYLETIIFTGYSNRHYLELSVKRLLKVLADGHMDFVRIELADVAQYHIELENAIEEEA